MKFSTTGRRDQPQQNGGFIHLESEVPADLVDPAADGPVAVDLGAFYHLDDVVQGADHLGDVIRV